MLRVREVKVKVEEKEKLKNKIATKLSVRLDNIKNIKILKESIDARKKPEIYYVYDVAVDLNDYKKIKNGKDIEEYQEKTYEIKKVKKIDRPTMDGINALRKPN